MPAITRSPRRRRMTYLARLRRYLQQMGPYLSVILLTVPFAFAEPVKIVALYVIGKGSWVTGGAMLITAYAISVCIVERLFRVLKSKMMTLRWFAVPWDWFVRIRDKALNWIFHRNPGRYKFQARRPLGLR